LGSGSKGNSTYLETAGARILIDAGFSARKIHQRLAAIGKSPESLSGILITHEHSDHISSLAVLCSKLKIPIYCNRFTQEAIQSQSKTLLNFKLFETGASFDIGDVTVDTFSVPHDAQDPTGFLLHTSAARIGFLTDLGHVTKMALDRIRSANVLFLESNHDPVLLQNDVRRPWSLKQRIMSRHGHLSNEAAADALAQVMSADLKHVFLGHLSEDCNRPEIARRVIATRLEQIGARHVHLELSQQHAANATLCL
jgi:phosphoribosyl 1,2-cyclic phosphodiesterase